MFMKKIVVTQNFGFTLKQKERLDKFGEVVYFEVNPKTPTEWLERVKGADIIVSESFGLLDNLLNLKNVFITYPFVVLGAIDYEAMRRNNIVLANAPGCNRDAVAEWAIAMLLNLFRKFPYFINNKNGLLEITKGLAGKKAVILGKGNIGSRVGEICSALKMEVDYFLRGNDLREKTKEADVIFNCLPVNESTKNLLDKDFFFSLKRGAYFITSSRREIFDSKAMLAAVKEGILAGAADDCSNERVGDTQNEYFQKLSKQEKILATPHIAWGADISIERGNEIVIDNIEAWLEGKPINLVS
jgi:glycerate dehydrogenase